MAQVVGCGEIRRSADESQLFSMTVASCCVCMSVWRHMHIDESVHTCPCFPVLYTQYTPEPHGS